MGDWMRNNAVGTRKAASVNDKVTNSGFQLAQRASNALAAFQGARRPHASSVRLFLNPVKGSLWAFSTGRRMGVCGYGVERGLTPPTAEARPLGILPVW